MTAIQLKRFRTAVVVAAAAWVSISGVLAADVRAALPTTNPFTAEVEPALESYDVVVLGATPAGVTAAVAAARQGERVVLIEPSYLIGGMMSGGLTKTDIGRPEALGGMAREFYDRVLAHYKTTYGPNSKQVRDCNGGYYFESKLALDLFVQMLAEAKVTVLTKQRLVDVTVAGHQIRSILTADTATATRRKFGGKVFVDGTYEGDLMAGAHVGYRFGREAKSEFGESMAGVTEGPAEYRGTGDHRVQAYNIRGGLTNNPDLRLPFPRPSVYYPDAAAGYVNSVKNRNLHSWRELFPNYEKWGMVNGHADSNSGDSPGLNYEYTESDYEGRQRVIQRVRDYWLSIWWGLQNDPTLPAEFRKDALNWGVAKDEYVESDHVTPQIYVRTSRRMLGQYFLTQNDLIDNRFKPDTICLGNYGFDSHPVQLLRTEEGLEKEGEVSGSTDLFAIPYRSLLPHGVTNLINPVTISASYVAYSSLRMEPVYMMIGQAAGEAAHLAIAGKVPVQDIPIPALQAELKKTNVPLVPTFRPSVSIRVKTPPPYQVGQSIEFEMVSKDVRSPLKMIAWNFDGTGAVQSKGNAASYVFKQPRDARVLLSVMDADGNKSQTQVLELKIGEAAVADIDVPFRQAKLKGKWVGVRGAQMEYYYRMGVTDAPGRGDEPLTPGEAAKLRPAGNGQTTATFKADVPRTGRYAVAMAFPSTGNMATNTPVTVTSADGEKRLTIDQHATPPFAFVPLGEYRFEVGKPAAVMITNDGTDGGVAADTVRWVWLGE